MVISMKFDLCSHHMIQRLTEFCKVINGRFIPFVSGSYDDHSFSVSTRRYVHMNVNLSCIEQERGLFSSSSKLLVLSFMHV